MPRPQSGGLAPPSASTSRGARTPSVHSISTMSASGSESSPSPASNPTSSADVGANPGSKFASIDTMLAHGKGVDTLNVSLSGLQALESVLQGVKTLPFIKVLASIGIQLLEYVIAAQITNDSFKHLTHRAKDVILAVARACDGMGSIAAGLEQDLQQLTDTMNSILSFATDKINRRTYRKLFTKGDDAQAVRVLEAQLIHAFHIFELQSSVSSRVMQDEMSRRLLMISPVSTPAPSRQDLIPNVPLHVPEGIYLIRNAANGRVLETDEDRLDDQKQHVYMASSLDGKAQTQLWSVQRNNNQNFTYDIRNIATGLVLDVFHYQERPGAKVVCHVHLGQNNQSWTFCGTRSGTTEDFCTIRSAGLPTVLDSICPKNTSTCDDLHGTYIAATGPTLSQEWTLIRLTSGGPDPVLSTPVVAVPRRPLLLQNVLTGTYATRTEKLDGPNVSLTPSILPGSSTWTFMYAFNKHVNMDCFCIVTNSTNPCTLDHYGSYHINVSKFWHTIDNHQWMPSARNGAFIFQNLGSGKLLAASRLEHALVDSIPAKARDDPACHWRLLDAITREPVIVLYDSALSVMPPELTSSPPSLPPPPPEPLTLNVGIASPETQLAMMNSFEPEHESIRALLQEGYKAIVVMPRKIVGWRNGRVKNVGITSDGAAFGDRRGISFEACIPT